MTGTSAPRLVLALHLHQPTGNVEHVFVEAHDTCYGPLVDALGRYPAVRFALHVSGPLLEWIEAKRPETLSLVSTLVSRGQVEILGGGWQEPILTALAPRDALGQLRTMRYECARLFGTLPRGMWLPERVWEPEIPALLADAGYGFTLVDDTHLRYAGVLDEHVTGFYVTERAGKPVTVLPISKALRYAIPFREPEVTTELLATRPGEIWTYGDDGEKFGLWPDTREWVWERGWLVRFLETLVREQEAGRLETVLPTPAIAAGRPSGRVYLPTASYREMGEWALPPGASSRLRDLRTEIERAGLEDLAEPFVRGGSWSGFLARYPESNWLHKRMLRVSEKVAAAERRDLGALGALSTATEGARRDLYRGQTNCAYWHGLFGGLYLPHLRRALWYHILRAENAVDPVDGVRITREDMDCDGLEEIAIETPLVTCTVIPDQGGCLAELVHRPSLMNVMDTLARRPELYHEPPPAAEHREADGNGIATIHTLKKSMSDEMRARLSYDDLPRRAFQDLLLPEGSELDGLESGSLRPVADMGSLPWVVTSVSRAEDRVRVDLACRLDLDEGGLDVKKRFTVHLPRARVAALYELSWSGKEPLEAVFATRLNVNLLAGDAPDRFYELLDPRVDLDPRERRLGSRGVWHRTAAMALVDAFEGLRAEVDVSPVADLARHPVETVSQTEGGYQLTYQGSCLTVAWPVRLESWVEWKASAGITISRMTEAGPTGGSTGSRGS